MSTSRYQISFISVSCFSVFYETPLILQITSHQNWYKIWELCKRTPTGICQRQIPSSSSFVIILFFIVRCQEWDGGHVFVLCSDASNDTESMNLAVDARAATLFDCNLNVPVILWKLHHLITVIQENGLYNNGNGKATNLCAVIKE